LSWWVIVGVVAAVATYVGGIDKCPGWWRWRRCGYFYTATRDDIIVLLIWIIMCAVVVAGLVIFIIVTMVVR
jgi:hypothetical protein